MATTALDQPSDPFRSHLLTLLSVYRDDTSAAATKTIPAYHGPSDQQTEAILGGFEAMLGRMRAAESEVKRLKAQIAAPIDSEPKRNGGHPNGGPGAYGVCFLHIVHRNLR